MQSPRRLLLAVFVLLTVLGLDVNAWPPENQETIARTAARLAPPDLHRQLIRNRESYVIGVLEPFQRPRKGNLEEITQKLIEDAILAIQAPRPLNEVAYRLGLVAHYITAANDPLILRPDRKVMPYRGDFQRYAQSVEPRLRVVFYGFRQNFDASRDLRRMLGEASTRSDELYPLIDREYNRIGFQSGIGRFTDRSTAYGAVSLAYSHAVTDIAEVLRYIWVKAGGIDTRQRLPLRGREMVRIPLQEDSRKPR